MRYIRREFMNNQAPCLQVINEMGEPVVKSTNLDVDVEPDVIYFPDDLLPYIPIERMEADGILEDLERPVIQGFGIYWAYKLNI